MQKDKFIWKVCGMRDAQNIREVEALGVDWMGFIFYSRSKRFVAVRPSYMPSQASRVGVFVNASANEILHCVESYGLQYVQLHGSETPAQCQELLQLLPSEVSIIKAFQIAHTSDFEVCDGYEGSVSFFLFDTPTPGYGGSGKSFDWSLLEHYRGSTPFLLSGGIGLDMIDALLQFHHPMWRGVDLNSKFELEPALKDAQKLKEFRDRFFE